MDNPRQHLVAAVSTLRQCGFFEEYAGLSDEEATGALLLRLSQVRAHDPWYIEHPEYRPDQNLLTEFGEPASAGSYKELASWDTSRVYTQDLEADVCEGNEVYAALVADYAQLSMGTLQPTDIRELWVSQEGPVMLSFKNQGRAYTTTLEYYDDWIDGEVFAFLEQAMTEAGFTAAIYNETDTGQEVFLVRATEAEKARMEQLLGWSFDWDQFLPDDAG